MTTVTVLMPVRAATAQDSSLQHWFEQAITSLLNQTYAAIDILLIGDADNKVGNWLPAKMARSSRVHLLVRDKSGIVSALNTGLKHADGQLIARMDADDIAHPERIQQQVALLEQNPDIDFCSSDVEIFSDDIEIGRGSQKYQAWLNSLKTPQAIENSVFIESPCPHPSWMLRRSLYQELDGYREVAWAEDYDFLLRAYLAGARMAKPGFTAVNETHVQKLHTVPALLKWRDHPQRLTRTDEHYSRMNFIRAKAWALSKSLLQQRSAIILGTGRNAKRLHDALGENKVEVDCFVELDGVRKKNSLRQRPVITYDELAKNYSEEQLIVSAITRYDAREKLRQWFDEHGMNEVTNYVFAG